METEIKQLLQVTNEKLETQNELLAKLLDSMQEMSKETIDLQKSIYKQMRTMNNTLTEQFKGE